MKALVRLAACIVICSGCSSSKTKTGGADMANAPNPFSPTTLFQLASAIKTAIGSSGDPTGTPIALVPNHLDPFWTPCQIGTGRAASEIGCPSVFQAPVQSGSAAQDISEQRSIVQELINEKYKGISLSAVDATMLNDLIQTAVSANTAMITIDSDAPTSARYLYMGTDNYNAGKKAGEALVQAVGTGKVAALAGFAGAANAMDRMMGIMDAIKGSGVQIIDTVNTTGTNDATTAAMNELQMHPDLAGFVSVYGYEGPAIAAVVKAQNKSGMVKVVCFDTTAQILGYVNDGVISATIGQRPYFEGYLSVYILYSMATLGVPKTMSVLKPWLIGANNDVIDTGTDALTKDMLPEYNAFLASLGVN